AAKPGAVERADPAQIPMQRAQHSYPTTPASPGAQRSFARFPWGLACPGHGVSNVLLLEIELGELGAHGVCALDTHGRKDDLAISGFHLEVLGRLDSVGHRLGQGELILGCDLCEHDWLLNKQEVRIPYFTAFPAQGNSVWHS